MGDHSWERMAGWQGGRGAASLGLFYSIKGEFWVAVTEMVCGGVVSVTPPAILQLHPWCWGSFSPGAAKTGGAGMQPGLTADPNEGWSPNEALSRNTCLGIFANLYSWI